jgi:hypothetical protein
MPCPSHFVKNSHRKNVINVKIIVLSNVMQCSLLDGKQQAVIFIAAAVVN